MPVSWLLLLLLVSPRRTPSLAHFPYTTLFRSPDPADTPIATVLGNLDRKNLVTITRHKRSTQYAARVSRQEHAAQLMEQVLQSSRDRAASILRFVDSMPESDLELLRNYLKDRDRGRPS